jgi:hypothetical protein
MFLLSPEADMRRGDLHAQVFVDDRVLVAGREARQRLSEEISGESRVFRTATAGALSAHGLSRNQREGEVFHSPTGQSICDG